MDLPNIRLDHAKTKQKILEAMSPLYIDEGKCLKLINVFKDELEKGLQHGLAGSSMQMENTFIPELLNGTENGQYLALDLGGTNFRVIKLVLQNGKMIEEIIEYYSVEEKLRLGPGEDLFIFLAECIKNFVSDEKNNITSDKPLPLGFTFSFPMTQKALDVGLLVNWTKSFNCPGVIGEDVVAMLNTALNKVGVDNVNVVAILNDTTGTLVAGSHDYPNCVIGLILGTGTNAAYIEDASKVLRWGDNDGEKHEGRVLMDPESGAFGDNGCIDFIKTEWDKKLDENSLLPGSFTFEKYFAGKYLGELTRLVFETIMSQIEENIPQNLTEKDSISTSDVSNIIRYSIDNTAEKPNILNGMSDMECSILLYICEVLSERAALLASLSIGTYLNRIKSSSESVIAVTGSLYKHHPTLASRMDHHTSKVTTFPFSYKLSDDGSGKGAGLVAAIASRLAKK